MRVSVIKLGTVCLDKATELKGTLTHCIYDMSGAISYIFQPKGLDDEGQPVKRHYVCVERLAVKDEDFEDVDVPVDILGTKVTDKASGFTGMAIDFIRHINGCFHVTIQPKGLLKDKKVPVLQRDFDLRGCTGEKIVQLSEEERKKSIAKDPSPTGDTFGKSQPTDPSDIGRRRI